jgi:hypothetical protein
MTPDNIPEDLQKVINRLKKSKNKEACVRKAYDELTKKHRGYRLGIIIYIHHLFVRDLNKLWNGSYGLLCTSLNYLLVVMLIKSGFFKPEEVKYKWSMIWYVAPHQYINVKIDKKRSINIDPWGQANGIKFGEYACGFRLLSNRVVTKSI